MSKEAQAKMLGMHFALGIGERQGNRGGFPSSLFKRSSRGQELVEFAVIFLVLMLFLFGIVDIGRLFHAITVITNAARVGARYGTAEACTITGGVFGCDTAAIIQETRAEAFSSGIDLSTSPVDVFPPVARGGSLLVNVRYQYNFFISGILPIPGLTLNRYAEMMVP